MIEIGDKSNCCGCTACASICNHEVITMKPDELGFLYPSFDAEKCVNCGLCEKVCQFNPEYNRYDNFDIPIAYSLRLKEETQLKRSQSGGAFFAIANYVIEQGGVVYGAAFDSNWRVSHQRASNLGNLEKLRMSKYVQSDLSGVFEEVKKDLRSGLYVLFSGTSCQVAGLKAYIPISLHHSLLCIDIICHGVPSPKIWEDYLHHLSVKYKGSISYACFRDNDFGRKSSKQKFIINGKAHYGQTTNYLYFQGYTIRDSCSNCYFTNVSRVGDFTIGDFWGAEQYFKEEEISRGISLVLINSSKAEALLSFLKSYCTMKEFELNNCLQPQLIKPTILNPHRKQFILDYIDKGFSFVIHKYGDKGWSYIMLVTKQFAKKTVLWEKIVKQIK